MKKISQNVRKNELKKMPMKLRSTASATLRCVGPLARQ